MNPQALEQSIRAMAREIENETGVAPDELVCSPRTARQIEACFPAARPLIPAAEAPWLTILFGELELVVDEAMDDGEMLVRRHGDA